MDSPQYSVVFRRASDRKGEDKSGKAADVAHPTQVEQNHLSTDTTIADALSCAFSLDTDILAVGTSRGSVKLLHSTSNFRPASFELTSSMCRGEAMNSAVSCVRFRPGADRGTKDLLLCASTDGTVSQWHLGSVNMVWSDASMARQTELYAADYEPTGSGFVTAGKDCQLRLYDESRRTPIGTLRYTMLSDTCDAHSSRIQALKWFEPYMLISGGWDNTVQLWDVRTRKATSRIFGAYLCGDGLDVTGNVIVTASTRAKNNLQMWDRRTLKPLFEIKYPIAPSTAEDLEPYASNLFAAKFSGDGKYLATGGSLDFRIFDVKKTLQDNAGAVAVPVDDAGNKKGGDDDEKVKTVEPVECGRILQDGGVSSAVFSVAWKGNSECAAVGYGSSVTVLRRLG